MIARLTFHRAVLAVVATLATSLALQAKAGGLPDNVVQAEIRPGWVTGNGSRMAALHLKLAPGWKTYWRAPGDAGIPPVFNWAGSDNLRGVSYHWPRPEVFVNFGMRSVGYTDELVLPIELHPKAKGQPIQLKGEIDLGVCETICMPARLNVEARLAGDGASDATIQRALANRPRPANKAGVGSVTCAIKPLPDGLRLNARIEMPRMAGEEVAMVEAGDPRIWVSDPEVTRQGNALSVQADLVPPTGKPIALDRSALRFTVIGKADAVDIRGCKAM